MTASAILSTPIITDAPPFRAAGSAPSRAALLPLSNHNYPANAVKAPSSKPQRPAIYSHYQPSPVYAVVLENPQADNKDCKALPGSFDNESARTVFLKQFDYVEMRCFTSRVELPKRPTVNEAGVIFHSPSAPGVNYDFFFQTTHEFLDLPQALRLFPMFIDLPLELRPSKTRYDATKNSEDLMLRVRCLFCRGRFGGKNAKAIWERHVKEHWPKLDRGKDGFKEEVKRPVRQAHKRPTGSNAHSRTRSQDSTWLPARLKPAFHDRVPSFGSGTSCSSPASSVMSFDEDDDVAIASPTYFSHVHEPGITDSLDECIDVEIKAPVRSPRRRLVRRPLRRQSSPGLDDDSDYDDCGMLRIGRWRIQAEIEEYQRLARPCLSQDEIMTALRAAAERASNGSPDKKEQTLASLNSPEDSQLPSPFSPAPTRKRSRSECEDIVHSVEPALSKRRHLDDTDSDSFSSTSGYDSSSWGSSLDLTWDSMETIESPESSFTEE